MRRTIAAILLAATMATPLAAQDWQGREGRQEARENRREIRESRREVRESAGEVRQQRREVAREVRQGDWEGARRERAELRQDRAELRRDRGDLRQDRREAWQDNRGRMVQGRDWRGDGRDGNQRWSNNGRWDNRWRNDDRYDWQGYRSQNRDRYRAPRYYAPRGYSNDYRRWSSGYRIQPYYYGRSYWISDPYQYRLPPAYGSYHWVRYHDDVMLVDVTNGLIADILYSFFW